MVYYTTHNKYLQADVIQFNRPQHRAGSMLIRCAVPSARLRNQRLFDPSNGSRQYGCCNFINGV
jgi:hypothetical protein